MNELPRGWFYEFLPHLRHARYSSVQGSAVVVYVDGPVQLHPVLADPIDAGTLHQILGHFIASEVDR